MFAALLGYNPIQMLLGSALTKLPAHSAAYLTGHSFFPSLISGPFQTGLQIAFDFSIAACLIAAVASLLRGKRYVHELHGESAIAGHGRLGSPAAGDVTPADIAPVAIPADVIEAEAGAAGRPAAGHRRRGDRGVSRTQARFARARHPLPQGAVTAVSPGGRPPYPPMSEPPRDPGAPGQAAPWDWTTVTAALYGSVRPSARVTMSTGVRYPVLSRDRSSSVGILEVTWSPGFSAMTCLDGVAATKVPTPGLVMTSPALRSSSTAIAPVSRLTPHSRLICVPLGICVPTGSSPLMIMSRMMRTICRYTRSPDS